MIKALLLAAAAAATTAPVSDVQSLIATEKAFSASAAQVGIPAAFRRYAASGGVVLREGKAMKVSEAFAGDAKGPDALMWRPAVAGVARSLDLGFDSGPFTYTAKDGSQTNGWFVTVWGKQADGTWRFLAGTDVRSGTGPSPAPEATPAVVQPGLPGNASDAFNSVQVTELRLSTYGASIARQFAPDAWVLRQGHGALSGKAGAELARKDPRLSYTPLAGGVSGDGDMVYFYGRAETAKARNNYLRVWQRRPEGWKVVVDALVPAAA